MRKFNFYFFKSQSSHLTYHRLNNSIKCYQQASDSPIQSISLFIINHFPRMRPPTLNLQLYQSALHKIDNSKSDYFESYHPFEQIWNNYLIDLVIKNHAICYQDTFYIAIPLQQQIDAKSLNLYFTTKTIEITTLQQKELCRIVFGLPQIDQQNKKIGIVSYRPTQNDPFTVDVNSIALLLGNLYNNESWTIIRLANETPSVEELLGFNCIIMPGSFYSVLSLPSHIKIAIKNIMQAYKVSPSLKILGICFGHQIIAQYFGSKIIKLARIGGIQKIVLNKNIMENPVFEAISNRSQLFLSQHHEDFVTSVPEGFKLLASSQSCQVQSYASNDGRIFACQFHVEYFCYFTKRFQKRMYTFHGYDLNKFYVKDNSQMEKINIKDSRLMLGVFRKFISD